MPQDSELPDDITVGPFLAAPREMVQAPEPKRSDELASEVLTAVLFLSGILLIIAAISEIAR